MSQKCTYLAFIFLFKVSDDYNMLFRNIFFGNKIICARRILDPKETSERAGRIFCLRKKYKKLKKIDEIKGTITQYWIIFIPKFITSWMRF